MKFHCFPKRQSRCLIYSNYSCFRSKIFSDLILQASPKNSLFFQYRNTILGHLIGSFFKKDISVPDPQNEYVGLVKENRFVLFEMQYKTPIKVWRSYKENTEWESEPFLGYQILSTLSKNEIEKKRPLLTKALSIHRKHVLTSGQIHGDLTHFNILHNSDNEIIFIDEIEAENSPLYDFFYFYAYLSQSVDKRHFLNSREKVFIKDTIKRIIFEVCNFSSKEDFFREFNAITIPLKSGLLKENHQRYLDEFSSSLTFDP